ncbi:MAG: phosphatidylglycerophosphatase A [Pseudomonadota bacterium]
MRWTNPRHVLAFGFGLGLSPKAPGTFGTLAGIPFVLACWQLPLAQYVLITLALALLGIWLCGQTARDLGVHDHPGIVWDEIVGYMITMTAAPPGWLWFVIGFVLFRFFDILKPWPIRYLDKHVHGGFGIMIDDVLAGIFAAIVLQLLAHWL